MIYQAPGKLVLAGAYAVLEGAPAVVTAVNRFAYADSEREAAWVTPEVRAAKLPGPAPWFDATELRSEESKLGLGSSAAILVASMAARLVAPLSSFDWDEFRRTLFPRALRAHREAQGGGSGLDVAASCFGGTLVFSLSSGVPALHPAMLPANWRVETWDSGVPASTAKMVRQVQQLQQSHPNRYEEAIRAQANASRRAVDSISRERLDGWLEAMTAQHSALLQLGRAAGVPIVTRSVEVLHGLAAREDAAVIPSGAGGGDVILYCGSSAASKAWRRAASEYGYSCVPLEIGATGVARSTNGRKRSTPHCQA